MQPSLALPGRLSRAAIRLIVAPWGFFRREAFDHSRSSVPHQNFVITLRRESGPALAASVEFSPPAKSNAFHSDGTPSIRPICISQRRNYRTDADSDAHAMMSGVS